MTDVVTSPTGQGSIVVSGKHSDAGYNYGYGFNNCNHSDHGAVEAAHRVAVQLGAATQTLSAQNGSEALGLSRQLGHAESNILNTVNQRIFDTNVAVEKTAAATNLAIEKIGAAAALEHCKNTAALAAAIAACCCEMKELVREDGEKTRSLINSVQLHNTQTELADLKMQLLLAKKV